MNAFQAASFAGLLAYVLGSIPFGFLLARYGFQMDIRQHGSGNIGATNVARVIGKRWGAIVLLLDCLKGLLPTLLLPGLFDSTADFQTWLPVLIGILTVVGHMFPAWLSFRGGKGVATGLGVALVLSWPATLAALVVFLVTIGLSRRTSAGSMLASIAFCITQLSRTGAASFEAANWAVSVFAIIVPVLIILRHWSNIVRLIRKEEPRFGDAVRQTDEEPADDPGTE